MQKLLKKNLFGGIALLCVAVFGLSVLLLPTVGVAAPLEEYDKLEIKFEIDDGLPTVDLGGFFGPGIGASGAGSLDQAESVKQSQEGTAQLNQPTYRVRYNVEYVRANGGRGDAELTFNVCDLQSGHTAELKDINVFYDGLEAASGSGSIIATQLPDLAQAIRDAKGSHDSSGKSTTGRCANAGTGTDTLADRQIEISIDIDEQKWKDLVNSGQASSFPQWANIVLMRGGSFMGNKLINFNDIAGFSSGQMNILFQSTELTAGDYTVCVTFKPDTCDGSVYSANFNKGDGVYTDNRGGDQDIFNMEGDFSYQDLLNNFNQQSGLSLAAAPAGYTDSNAIAGSSDLIGSGGDDSPTCESTGGSLSWIMCSVINAVAGAADAIHDNMITPLLKNPGIDTNEIVDDPSTGEREGGTFAVWSNFRNIANVIIVFALLFIVFGQAIGGGLLDAYTVKKALPRVLIAAIGINLSFYIIAILNDLTAVLGGGIANLIRAPFGELNYSFSGTTSGLGLAGLFAAAGGIWIAGGGLLSFLWAFLLLPVFLSLLGAAVVLVLRRGLLMLLVFAAPVAIALFAIPGGEKYFNKYRSLLFTTLLIYPIFEAIWAVAQVLAVSIAEANGNNSSTIVSVIGLVGTMIALFAPLFLIPFSFKIAGGIMGTLGGFINDRSKGVIDRSKKRFSEKGAQNRADIKAGNRFKGNSALSRRASRALQTTSLIPSGGYTLSTAKRQARMQTARNNREFELANEFLEKNETARAIKGDDDKMWAVMRGTDEQSVRAELMQRAPERFSDPRVMEQAVAEVMRFKREAGDRVGKVAATLAQAGTGTGFNYRDDGVDDDMIDAIIDVSGDNRGLSGRMLAQMRSSLGGQRIDLSGGGFAKSAMIMDKRRVARANGNKIAQVDSNGNFVRDAAGKIIEVDYTKDHALLDIHQDVLQSNAGAAIAGKVVGVKQLVPVMKANLDAAIVGGDSRVIAREAAKILGKQDAAAAVAPQNAEAMVEGLSSQKLQVSSLPQDIINELQDVILTQGPDGQLMSKREITYSEFTEGMRKNRAVQEMRREYEKAGLNAAQIAASLPGSVPPGTTPGQFQAPTFKPPGP